MADKLPHRVVVGRESVHDRELAIVGYELQFGSVDIPDGLDGPDSAGAADPSTGISSSVVFGALAVGVDRLVGDKQVFLNADRGLLLDRTPLTLLPARSVIEIGPDVGYDVEIVTGCRRLADQGFAIALDEFDWFAGAEQLLEIASIVKIDVAVSSTDLAARLAERCRRYGVRVLADNVHTAADLDQVADAPFDLFQGAALQPPTHADGRPVGAIHLDRLRSAAGMLGQQVDFYEVEEFLRTEPGLTYQVLQLASLGRVGENRRTVGSIREALVLAGTWRIQSWITLLLSCPAEQTSPDVMTAALSRARACELLVCHVGESTRLGFMAGMVSAFEQVLQIPAAELCASLPLADDLRDAAFGGTSPLAGLVCDVADRQAGIRSPRLRSPLTAADVDAALGAGYAWALHAGTALAP
jgi:EAL and modified HD-GYP domain-containing signal transduction protein